jgi:hypothetical protein
MNVPTNDNLTNLSWRKNDKEFMELCKGVDKLNLTNLTKNDKHKGNYDLKC